MNTVTTLLSVVLVTIHTEGKIQLPPLKNGGVHWALLVAGSRGWMNYRHQADVCHAYQILKDHGLPDERIVVMMADDIAYNDQNPIPGVIINRPGGPDVYKGVPKDYTGKEVNPDNFLAVLQGNRQQMKKVNGSGKVIDSGENDNIFVNFVDHGAPGLIAFGENMLHAEDLNNALKDMHSSKKYNKMLFYLEACESGSMFKKFLGRDLNIFAVTAANSTQSSYACYFDKKRQTFLGDVFSVNWMQDSDIENLNRETIEKQFNVVKEETNTSHVMQFGDLLMGDLQLSDFQGGLETNKLPVPETIPDPNIEAVASEDVEIAVHKYIINMYDTSDEDRQLAMKEIARIKDKRAKIDDILKHIVSLVSTGPAESFRLMMGENEIGRSICYKPVVEYLKTHCEDLELPLNGYAMKQLQVIVNLCERPFSADTIMEAIDKVCEMNKAS